MRILFIYSERVGFTSTVNRPILDAYSVPLGLSYISSLLKVHGHQTEALVLTRETSKPVIDQFITQFQPAIIGFSVNSSEYFFIKKTAEYIKTKFPSIYLLVGGAFPSLVPKQVIAGPFDALCIGEGEYPTLELVQQLEQGKTPRNIPNLWIKTGTGIEKNPPRPFIQDLDSLPFPDRDMWKRWLVCPDKTKETISIGRGCPFNCTYCSNHAFRKLAAGKHVRLRSVESISQEIREITAKFPDIQEIYFQIDTIGVDFRFIIKLCNELEKFNHQRQIPVKFTAMLRIVSNKDFTPLFHALKKANFYQICIGLESGSERIRKNILRRHYSNADFRKVTRIAKEKGLGVVTINMIGFPGETQADFKETVRLNRICMPDSAYLSIFFPYPGTKLFEICKDMDLLPPSLDTRMEYQIPNLDLPGFSKKQIQREYRWFWYNVYRGHRPFLELLRTVLSWRIDTSLVLKRIKNKFIVNNNLFFRIIKSVLRRIGVFAV